MKEERDFIRQVKSAREDMQEADELIRTYMPFIKQKLQNFSGGVL